MRWVLLILMVFASAELFAGNFRCNQIEKKSQGYYQSLKPKFNKANWRHRALTYTPETNQSKVRIGCNTRCDRHRHRR